MPVESVLLLALISFLTVTPLNPIALPLYQVFADLAVPLARFHPSSALGLVKLRVIATPPLALVDYGFIFSPPALALPQVWSIVV